jgi:hypothetical protein
VCFFWGLRLINFRLLFFKVFPLTLRPLALLLEAVIHDGIMYLVIVMPAAMIALKASSVPVYMSFITQSQYTTSTKLNEEYSQAIFTIIILVSIVTLLISLLGLYQAHLVYGILLAFVVEKLCDEVSRIFEYQKKYLNWFWMQILRNGWYILPLLVSYFFDWYYFCFFVGAVLSVLLVGISFIYLVGFYGLFSLSALVLIYKKFLYVFGGAVGGLFQQGPRLIVAELFSDWAHVYSICAQISQSFAIVFNVKFQIPYRAVIAKKTRLFYSRIRPFTDKIMNIGVGVSGSVLVIYLGLSDIYSEGFDSWALISLLAVLLPIEAVVFSVITSQFGYVLWILNPKRAFMLYIFSLLLFSGFISFIVFAEVGLMVFHVTIFMIGFYYILNLGFRIFINARFC